MDVTENLWALARSENPVNVEIGRSMAASVGCPPEEYEEAVNWGRGKCKCDMCAKPFMGLILQRAKCNECGNSYYRRNYYPDGTGIVYGSFQAVCHECRAHHNAELQTCRDLYRALFFGPPMNWELKLSDSSLHRATKKFPTSQEIN